MTVGISEELLDKLDSDILKFLKENEGVESSKIILTGVNNFTKRGISFDISFFVKASTDMEYSDKRHRIITDLAQIIKENRIELVMIHQDYADESKVV